MDSDQSRPNIVNVPVLLMQVSPKHSTLSIKRSYYRLAALFFLILGLQCQLQAQAVFESNTANGDWDAAGSWTLISGSDADGIPDANDDVTILAGDQINVEPSGTVTIDDITVTGTLNFGSNGRTLQVDGNMTMNGTSAITGNNGGNTRVLSVSGNLTISTGASATINGQRVIISGTTTIQGTLGFGSTAADKTFGDIEVTASGTWDNSATAEDFEFTGNVENNGTWNGCSNNGCLYEFTSTTAEVSGTGVTEFADLQINSPAVLTNNGIIQLTDDLTGTGTLNNGATGDFRVSGTGPLSISSSDFTAVGNTFTYNGSGNITALTTTYYDLVVDKGTNRLDVASTITVNNDVTVTSGEFRINVGTANIGNDLLVQGGEYSSNNASAATNITGDLNMSSGTIDHNNGDVDITGDLIITNGAMDFDGTSTLDVSDVSISTGTVEWDSGTINVTNASGGVTLNSGNFDINGATVNITNLLDIDGGTNTISSGTLDVANTQIASSQLLTIGNATFSNTNELTLDGTITFTNATASYTLNDITLNATGNWNVTAAADFTFSGDITNNGASWVGCSTTACIYDLTNTSGSISGSTQTEFANINIDAPAAYTSTGQILLTGDLTGTGSFTNGTGANLELSGGGSYTITSFDASTVGNTVVYSGTGASEINPGDYYDLTIDKVGTNTMTVAGAVNVGNDLTIDSGELAIGAATLDVTNNIDLNNGEFTPNDLAAVVNVGGDFNMANGTYDHNDGDVNITGDMDIDNGLFTINESTLTSTLDVSNMTVDNATLTLSEGEINVNGVTGLTVSSGSLTLAGSSLIVDATYAVVGGTNDLNTGSMNTGSLDISSGQLLTVGNISFTVSSALDLDGTITFDATGGTNSLNDLTVNATGNWNVAAAASFTFSGDITNNGASWVGCSTTACIYDLTNTSGSISGSTQTEFANINIDAPAAYTSTGQILLTGDLTGTGSFTNGTGANLELSGGGSYTITSFDASTVGNTVVYSGTGASEINPGDYYDLTIDKVGTNTMTVAGAVNVGNDLTIDSGELAIGAATLDVTNNIDLNNGEFTPNDLAAVVNVGGDFNMANGTYDHNDGDVNITGNLDIDNGTFDINETTVTSTLDVNNMTVDTATLNLNEGEINVNGVTGLTVSSGSLTLAGSSLTVNATYALLGGTNDLNAGALNVEDLSIATGQLMTVGNLTFTVNNGLDVDGTIIFDVNTGTYSINDVTINAGGTWDNASTSDFTISGNIVSNGTAWNGCSSNNGCDYTLTSTTGSISGSTAISMTDVIINGAAAYTSSADITIEDVFTGTGSFTNATGGILRLGAQAPDIANFTASATGNSVIYNGTGDQDLLTATSGEYYDLEITTSAAGNDVSLGANLTVLNELTLTTGDLQLDTFDFTMEDGALISGGNADSYVMLNDTGVLIQNYSAAGATLSFPIGDNNDYSPINSLTIHSATFGANASLNFSITDAAHPNRDTDNTALGGNDDGTPAVDYISRYWTIGSNNITDEDFSATYTYTDLDIIGTEANMIAALYGQPPGETFFDWKETGTVNATNNTASISNANYWGDLYAMDNNMERLPVNLLSFTGQALANSVMLKWTTASEENNSYFSVERSTDGLSFKQLSVVQGAGTTNSLKKYSFEDKYPLKGRLYYRLKQVDFNGQFEYSPVVSVQVDFDERPISMSLFPNPAMPSEVVKLKIKHYELNGSTAIIKIVNQMGLEVWSSEKAIQKGEPIQLPSLPRGTYLVHVFTNQQKLVNKLLIR